jgi:DNA modification methylase
MQPDHLSCCHEAFCLTNASPKAKIEIMGNMTNKSKLKRDRKNVKQDVSNPGLRLFPELKSSSIESRSPTPDDPALRRFIPAPDVEVSKEFAKLRILDWREKRPARIKEIKPFADSIICGDSESVLKTLPSDCIDSIVTSPPYWNVIDYGFEGQIGECDYDEYLMQLLGVWKECERILAPNGKLCINTPIMPISKKVIPNQHTRHLKNLNNDIESVILDNLTLNRFSLYIWQKQTTEKMFGSYPYPPNLYEQNTIEFINVFVKNGKPKALDKKIKECSRLNEKQWMNLTRQIWSLYPEDVKRVSHPAPFPESMPNRIIAMYTFASAPEFDPPFPGDIVLDPFNGTGATCVAAKKLGRRYIGIDLSPHFCISAQKRLNHAIPDGRVFLLPDKNGEPANGQFQKAMF